MISRLSSQIESREISEPFLKKLIRGQTVGIGILVIMVTFGGIFDHSLFALLPLGVLAVIVGAAASLILRRGHFFTSGYLFFIGTSIAISINVYIRGYQDASTIYYLWPILGAVSILERRGVVVLITSLFSYLALAIGQRLGYLNPPLPFDPQGGAFLTMGSFAVMFSLLAYLVWLSSQNTRQALNQAQQAAHNLQEINETLESHVADRTKALTTSSEVSRRISTIFNRKELVSEVVNQVKNSFGYYHAQIYFYDAAKDNLVMAGGTGEAGEMMLAQFHKVAKGRGLVGRAAESNEAVLVSNTTKSPEWLPNPLLPDTKSEAATPISIGDEVLGVLDIQHNVMDGLQKEDVDSLQSIANQIAIALQNIESTETVAKRATELQTVARISTVTATISNVQKMLESVVHLTQRGFGLYHAHVFTYNENMERLEIVACGYKEGDEHEGTHGTASIPLEQEQSLVARAARSRQAVIVNDVRSDPGWLPNPLLPDTASEMAVPMIVGEQLVGVLDVQSERINAFTEEDASIQTTLASQVATSLQNARSFTQAQRQAERETSVNLITQRIQSATSIEAALQIAARELGHALGMKQTMVSLEPSTLPGDGNDKKENA